MSYYKYRISTLKALEKHAKNKRSVFCPHTTVWKKPTPAAFVINLPGAILLKMFRGGMFVYNKDRHGC